jgi:putative ABC transport system permease protein
MAASSRFKLPLMRSRLTQLGLSRHLWRHPWQLALAILGIALGVAVVLAVDLANASARKSFQLASEQLTGRATHRVINPAGTVAESVYALLRLEFGLRTSAPVLKAYVSDLDDRQYQLLGIDPLAEAAFRDYLTVNPAADSGANTDLIALLTESGAALLPPEHKARDELQVQSGSEIWTLHSAGHLNDPALAGLIVVDIATAQEILDRVGQLSHIDLILSPDPAQLSTIQQALPEGLQLEPAAANAQSTLNMSAAFSLNLTAMSLLALLVGIFLIYNTMSFTVVQRRRLLGMLRALGVTRREVFGAILLEALLLGFIGTLLGIALGVWLGGILVQLVTRTINDLYYVLSVTDYFIAPASLAKGILLGLGASLVAAYLPAQEAAAAPPGVALSRADLERRWRAGLMRQVLVAALLLLIGAAVLWWSTGLIGGFSGLFAMMMACALLIPALIILLVHLLQPLLHGYLLGAMALRSVARHLSRTGVAVAALTIAFSATVGVAVMVDSFRGGVTIWLQDLLTADFYISPVNEGEGAQRDLAPEVLTLLRQQEGVAAMSLYRGRSIRYREQTTALLALDPAAQTWAGYRFAEGDAATAWEGFSAGQGVLVTEPLAYRQGLNLGDSLVLQTPAGSEALPILGIIYDYGSEHGRILLHLDWYRRHWEDNSISSVAVYTASTQSPEALREHLQIQLGPLQALAFRSSAILYQRSLEVFERTFTITGVLRLLAIAVAFVGMLSALMALLLERRREFAVLRALGMTPRQIEGLVILQTGFMGLIAGLLAIPVGLGLAWVLIDVINRRSFGWSLPFEINSMILVQTVLLAILAAVMAVIYPLWRQRQVQIAGELREE